jgi:outer membrane protein OmpA-like peptidoglycan-associated protein
MGANDTIGTSAFNRILSQERAYNVKIKFQELDIAADRLNAIYYSIANLKREG